LTSYAKIHADTYVEGGFLGHNAAQFPELHDVTNQKTSLFIVTAVRTLHAASLCSSTNGINFERRRFDTIANVYSS
jgi:hypothetical protein